MSVERDWVVAMGGHTVSWRRRGLLACSGGATIALTSLLTAAAAFGDVDDPLWGSDTAIIVGGTFESTPDKVFAQTVESLYLNPLGFDDGATASTVCDMVGTDPCAAPLQVLTTPELLQQGPGTLSDADDITLAVEHEFAANPGAFSAEHPLTIFGYSQGAAAESVAMTRLAQDGIPSSDLHFVFIGDPSLPTGIGPNLPAALDSVVGSSEANSILTALGLDDSVVNSVTPDDLYPATIYTLDGDGVADFQQDFTAGGLQDALYNLFTTHAEYLGLTSSEIANAATTIDGDLTNIDISDNINGFDALFGALEHGIGSSGLFESLFESLQLFLTNTF